MSMPSDNTRECSQSSVGYRVPFTQYLLPYGRKREVWIELCESVGTSAQTLIDRGCRFECELLRTGQVSLTAEMDDEDGETAVLAMRVIPNGPGVRAAVESLIAEAFRAAPRQGGAEK